MSNTKFNLVHLIPVLSFSLLILSASAAITHPDDVEAILKLQGMFPALGLNSTLNLDLINPCFPTPYPWISCSSGDIARVTALNCGNKKLIGVFGDFSPMDALEKIDFSDNHLTQDFPDFVTKFPKLNELNLANNNLFGTVPTSLEKDKDLKLTLTGNKLLCFSDEDVCSAVEILQGIDRNIDKNEGSRKNSLQIMFGTVISMFVMFWVIV